MDPWVFFAPDAAVFQKPQSEYTFVLQTKPFFGRQGWVSKNPEKFLNPGEAAENLAFDEKFREKLTILYQKLSFFCTCSSLEACWELRLERWHKVVDDRLRKVLPSLFCSSFGSIVRFRHASGDFATLRERKTFCKHLRLVDGALLAFREVETRFARPWGTMLRECERQAAFVAGVPLPAQHATATCPGVDSNNRTNEESSNLPSTKVLKTVNSPFRIPLDRLAVVMGKLSSVSVIHVLRQVSSVKTAAAVGS
jgi:hypothetical protein